MVLYIVKGVVAMICRIADELWSLFNDSGPNSSGPLEATANKSILRCAWNHISPPLKGCGKPWKFRDATPHGHNQPNIVATCTACVEHASEAQNTGGMLTYTPHHTHSYLFPSSQFIYHSFVCDLLFTIFLVFPGAPYHLSTGALFTVHIFCLCPWFEVCGSREVVGWLLANCSSVLAVCGSVTRDADARYGSVKGTLLGSRSLGKA
ncbi:hypothetical protein HOY80DRAFT_1092395 [Tuber brumale]|nr:hypothetical protein HOY80DRAFT_1092395 [Tuber brumale]